MPSHQCSQTAVIKGLLFVCLLYSGSRLEAQIEAPAPVPTTEAPSKSKETSDDSELKIHSHQLKHAKAAEVLKLFKQLHGVKNVATVDERTNSIVFLANETNARELRASLALLDGDAPIPIIPPTPVLKGSSPQAPAQAKYQPLPTTSKPAGPFRKFTFKHAKVADVVKILRELTGATIDKENMEGFAVDERTNSVIWKVKDEWESQHWEETLLTMDGESSTGRIQSAPSPYAQPASMPTPIDFAPTPNSQVSAQETQTFTFSMGFERGESVESLKQRYNELEQKAHQLADKLKQSKSPSESERTELKTAVRKSFEARQALQRAELADLAQRMKSMQQSIDMRDKLADKVVQRRVEDLLDPNLKWEVTRTSNESTRSISKEDSISSNTTTSSQEMQAALQGTWNVRVFQSDNMGDDRVSQVVVRGDLLLVHTIVNGKVLGVSPWKLVWPNAERPYELGVIWDPNSNAESNLFMPGRIAYDGKSFQLAWGENLSAICPGENITYIDCVRTNIEDRSTAAQATYQFGSQVRTTSSLTGHTKSDTGRQPVVQAIKELITQLPFEETQTPPFGIVVSDIEVTAKEELGDFKEVIQEQITAELKTFAHLYVISRRSAEAAIHGAGVKWTDVVIPDRRAKYVDALKKEGHAVDLILFVKLVGTANPTEYLLALELMDRGGRSHKCSATISLPETSTRFMKQRVQGNWIVESLSAEAKDGLLDQKSPLVLSIDGETLSLLEASATPLDMQWRGLSQSSKDNQPIFAVDFVLDPNGKRVTAPGILSCDGEVLRICYCTSEFDNLVNDAFRPDRFLAGTKVNLFTCRRAPAASPRASELSDADLSTPQATLDTIHRYSVDHPMGVHVECYTEPALHELSGVMLQQLCFMSGLSQVGLRTGGVIGVKDNAPMVAGTPPSFHLSVDALIKEHSLPTPPEECTKAFELLAKLTLGAAFSSEESLVKPDRELFRLAAGILKSPKEFLPKAGELSERFNDISGDNESPKKESKAQPKYLIKIDGDEATATQIVDSDKPSVPMSFKLQRINQRWLVSEAFSDEILNQMISSMSQVLGAMSAIESEVASQRDSSDSKKAPDADNPLYSGHPISWWLDSYWDNATASPKTTENQTQEYVAFEAIRKLRELPECKAAIESTLEKWFELVEHEVNEGQLTRAAKCIVTIAGPAHQESAVNLLFKIWKRMPLLAFKEQSEMADDATELNQLLSQLVLNDQLAAQFAERLTNGDSSDRSLVLYGFLSLMGRFGVETNNDLTELENWLRQHAKRLAPAVEAASHDVNEKIRFTSLIQLATLIHATKLDPEFVRLPTILLTAASDASPNVRYISIELLTSNELAPTVKTQNIEIAPMLIKTLESDSSTDVRYSALGALMELDAASELVHATLLEWARCKERLQVENALSLMLRNHEACDRPQSIDELIELLSDPEWGVKVEVNYNNWSTHHRWARQYAIAILGQYAAHAHRAIPTLDAEVARNNKDTLSFATIALDSVRGYCPDLPIDKLQGEWEFVTMQKPEGSSPFFDFQASSDQPPSSVITITGTQLKLGDRVLAELSHYRSGSRQGVALLLDPDGKKRHCHGGYSFKGGLSPENVAPAPELLLVEVSELLNNLDATQATKQIYKFRRVKK